MANRFESPIASEFINTYVPIPFKEMMQAGAMKQDRYDKGAAALDEAVQRAEMIRAIPNSPDERYKNKAIQTMHDITNEYATKDLADSFVRRELNNKINSSVDKNLLQKIQESRGMWDEAQKGKRELALNDAWNSELDTDPGANWDSNEGVYNYAPAAYHPKEKTLDPYFDEIKEPSYKSTILNEKDVNYGMQLYETDASDIDRVVTKNANQYASTTSGKAEIRLRRNQMTRDGVPEEEQGSNIDIAKSIMNEYGERYKRKQYAGTRLPMTQRDGEGSGSKTQHTLTDVLINLKAGTNKIPGTTAFNTIKVINKGYDEAKAALSGLDPNSDEAAKLRAEMSKVEDARIQGELEAREVIDPKIASIKQQAFDLISKIPEYKDFKKEEINALIDSQFAEGFMGGVRRTATNVHQGVDKVTGGVPAHILQFITNAVTTAGSMFKAGSTQTAVAKTIVNRQKEKGDEPWSLGEVLTAPLKIVNEVRKDSKVTTFSNAVDKAREKDLANILRDVTKNVNRQEREIQDKVDEYVVNKLQYIVSKKQLYPIPTIPEGDHRVILGPNGERTTSKIYQTLKMLPVNQAGFEVRELGKDNVFKPLKKDKNVKEAANIMALWDMVGGGQIETDIDDKGNTVLTVAYTTPKGEGTPTMKTYEVKFPAGSGEAIGAAEDAAATGTPEGRKTALKLINHKLHNEITQNVDDPNGHDYEIDSFKPGKKPTVVNVVRIKEGYRLTVNDEIIVLPNPEAVRSALYDLQWAALEDK